MQPTIWIDRDCIDRRVYDLSHSSLLWDRVGRTRRRSGQQPLAAPGPTRVGVEVTATPATKPGDLNGVHAAAPASGNSAGAAARTNTGRTVAMSFGWTLYFFSAWSSATSASSAHTRWLKLSASNLNTLSMSGRPGRTRPRIAAARFFFDHDFGIANSATSVTHTGPV